MKINYKIIWLDDQPRTMEKYIDKIKIILADNYFIPEIKKPYVSYEDFHHSFEASSSNDVYGEIFNDCDLLLIDYHIAEKQENEQKTGATIIAELRSKGIYTETVFYSNAMDDYRKMLYKEELDNVIYADKNELVTKVEQIIRKSVVQSMVISNLRGYLMDCTSDFDFICRTVSEYYFKQLNDEQQIEILQKAEEYIHTQYKSENEKFIKINKKYKNDKSDINIEILSGISSYSEIVNKNERINLLHRVFSSLESVIVVRDKFRLMALILQKKNIGDYSKIYSFEKEASGKTSLENDNYFNTIIKHRNNLAHNKLKYGDKCKNRIKIIKVLEDIDCDCKSNECERSYSYDDCKTLRKSIYNYYSLFIPLLEGIIPDKSDK
jgi:hypothetical protein